MAATLNITCRSLTDVFIMMRNNSLQTKHMFSDQSFNDKVALVSSGTGEEPNTYSGMCATVIPLWVEGIDDIQYEMSRIRLKLQELTVLHETHLTRPSLDDKVREEKDIEALTQDITRMFHHCKKIIQQIRQGSIEGSHQEKQIKKNILTSLVSSLQELSVSFHSAQSTHLKKLQSREEKSQHFSNPNFSCSMEDTHSESFHDDQYHQTFLMGPQYEQQQQLLLETNTLLVGQREREIKQIVQSMAELNDIFKDLSTIVADQGTVLDRIDYNLEQVQSQVRSGMHQLEKATKYQKRNCKMMCILCMSGAIVLLIIMLVIFKS